MSSSARESSGTDRPYAGRRIALATKHGKEAALAGPIRARLGAVLVVPPALDTDVLGTFTGEVERVGDSLAVARTKAALGMAATGLSAGLATEGSFGPHPTVPFIAAHHELVLFVDRERGIEVAEEVVRLDSNFAHAVVASIDELDGFLAHVGFADQGLIVRPSGPPRRGSIEKGIHDRAGLAAAVERAAAAAPDHLAHVETDMRANHNPARLRVLADVADRLAERLATPCPACGSPGWGRIDTVFGLPCEACGTATDRVLAEIEGCPACPERRQRPRRDGRRTADQGHCPWCNP